MTCHSSIDATSTTGLLITADVVVVVVVVVVVTVRVVCNADLSASQGSVTPSVCLQPAF